MPASDTPTLSVTVLNYNYAQHLPQCLESILSQSFRDYEVIVIDDCSTDNSIQVIEPYLNDSRVRLVAHSQNSGYVNSLIQGTETLSRGRIVQVISADDVAWSDDAFSQQISLLHENEHVPFCFTAFQHFSDDYGLPERLYRFYDTNRILSTVDAFSHVMTHSLLHSGTMIRRWAYDQSGGYRRDLRFAVDFALWPLLALRGGAAYCSDLLYGYRIHGNQMSHAAASTGALQAEFVDAIERASRTAAHAGIAAHRTKREALQYTLMLPALHDAFNGRYLSAARSAYASVRIAPGALLLSRPFAALIARLLLGRAGFEWMQGLRSLARTTRSS